MSKISAFLYDVLHSGKEPEKLLWDNKRIIIINFIILVSTPVFFFFTYLNIQHGLMLFALSNIINIVLLFIAFFYFRLKRNINHVSTIILIILLITYFTTIFQGGIANTGFFWFFYFPLFAIMLKGHKIGSYWIFSLLMVIAGVYLFQIYRPLTLPYDPILLVVLFISLGIETVIAIFLESVRLKYDKRLQEFNTDLKTKVALEVQENRKKDELLRQQSKMAAMGEMTNYIAHQWKQPLSTISAIVQNLHIQEDLGILKHTTITEEFQKIETQIAHMSQTMIDFNNFTKPDQPKEDFNIAAVIQESADMISPLLTSKGIALHLEIYNDTSSVFGQRNLLTHVLLNLINNAKDALLSQNIKGAKVVIRLDKTGKELEVSDNGEGVDPSIKETLFEAYTGTKGDQNGGVGLHMCKRIVEDTFNGTLTLEKSTKGARFVIHF